MDRTRHKDTIIVIMVGCLALYVIFPLTSLWVFALCMGIVGITSEKLTYWIHIAWMWIAEKLHYVMSRLILGALFIVILLPVAMLAKFFRKDIMMLKDSYPSYFVENDHVFQKKDFENPW